MKIYIIWYCQKVCTGKKRIIDTNSYLEESEFVLTQWKVWKKVKGQKVLVKTLGKYSNVVNNTPNYKEYCWLPKPILEKGDVVNIYFCVTDENGFIEDYDKILENTKKKPRHHKGYSRYGKYRCGCIGNELYNEMRQTVTPQEIEEAYKEYGIRLNPCPAKRKLLHKELNNSRYFQKNERNWKKFRKHQWK